MSLMDVIPNTIELHSLKSCEHALLKLRHKIEILLYNEFQTKI